MPIEKTPFYLIEGVSAKKASTMDPLHLWMPLTFKRPAIKAKANRKAIKAAKARWKIHSLELCRIGDWTNVDTNFINLLRRSQNVTYKKYYTEYLEWKRQEERTLSRS